MLFFVSLKKGLSYDVGYVSSFYYDFHCNVSLTMLRNENQVSENRKHRNIDSYITDSFNRLLLPGKTTLYSHFNNVKFLLITLKFI